MALSYNEAIEIAQKFAKEISEKYQDKILAVFCIGSLGSDYYRPGQSDIDTFIIVNGNRDIRNQMYHDVRKTADRYQDKYNIPKGFGAIIVADEQLYPPYVKEEELILEILRLKTQSKLIYGGYDVDKIPMPDKQAIIDDAIAFVEWLDGEAAKSEYKQFLKKNPSMKDKHTIKEFSSGSFVNSALISLKRYLIIKHNIIEFNKFKVIGIYLANDPPFVNDEVFDYINSILQEKNVELDDEKILRMEKWSDELSVGIDNLVLYNK